MTYSNKTQDFRAGHHFLAGALIALALLATQPVAAQVSDDEVDDTLLPVIIVTAQRRSETLQSVPISAEILTGEEIATQNLNSLVEVAAVKPSVRVAEGGRNSDIFIRGTGSGESQSFDQSVGTFIDDIYHGRSRTSVGAFLDLERVEILKGPQTTYFGNNAIAGAFNIVTKKPTDEFEGWVRALVSPDSGRRSGEDGGQYAIEGALNVPLSDAFALRVAAAYNGHDGYFFNTATNRNGPEEERRSARATLRYNPDERLDLSLKAEWSESSSTPGLFAIYENCPPPVRFGGPAGLCAIALGAGGPIGIETHEFANQDGAVREFYTVETVLNVDYQIGDLTLTSTTGYYDYDFVYDQDTDSMDLELVHISAPEDFEQFSQEFRVSSPTGRDFEYMAGLYFQSDDLAVEQNINFFLLTPLIESVPPLAPLVPFLPLAQNVSAHQESETYSVFAALTWNLNDKLSLTTSLRGTIVDKELVSWEQDYGTATRSWGGFVPFPDSVIPLAEALGLGAAGTISLDRTDEGLMPGARLQYDTDGNTMLYASYTRGFKAGGFNFADTTADPVNFGFEPEYVDAFELGAKSELLDRRLRLNVAVFLNDFSDLQVAVSGFNSSGGFTNFVRNAAESRSQGIELEANWAVSSYFTLSGAVTLLDSEYRDYQGAEPTEDQKLAFVLLDPANNDPDDAPRQDLSGHTTPFAPDYSGNVSGTFTFPLLDRFDLSIRGTLIFSDEYQLTASDDPLTIQPSYTRVDAGITFAPQDGAWAFDVIGTNLNDETIRTFSTITPTTFGTLLSHRMPYRTVAIQLRYEF